MNVYYAISSYHVLCCILHCIKYHSKEKNILYLSKWHNDCDSMIVNLKNSGFFNKVCKYEEVIYPSSNKKISNKQIKKDIDYLVVNTPSDFINDVSMANNIYISGDSYSCSVYLIEKKIKYNYFEDACGVLSDVERNLGIIRNMEYSRYQIMKKLLLPGNHKYIINRYGDLGHQLPGYSNKKDIDFSVDSILGSLNYKQLIKVAGVFTSEKIIIPDNSTLLLTFHYINLNILSVSMQHLLYGYLIDYFGGKNNILIKQHPSDSQPDYKDWFSNSYILPRTLPSELLPYLSKSKISRVLTAYSTSIFSLKKYCDDIISFDSDIAKDFVLINKYYFILKMLSKINIKYPIYGIGLNESIVENIIKEYSLDLKINFVSKLNDENKKIVIFGDEMNYDIINPFDIAFSINYTFNSNPIIITKKSLAEISDYNYLDNECFGFYCLDDSINKIIQKVKLSKVLNSINVELALQTNFNNYFLNVNEELNKLKTDISEFNLKMEEEKKNIIDLSNEKKYYKDKYEDVINSSSWKISSLYRKIGFLLKKILGR
ncbi:MAG: hypothetical protein IKG40_01055 [Bacilli bacterium]|nr:hypothetical protein [Bacilli bacterium]